MQSQIIAAEEIIDTDHYDLAGEQQHALADSHDATARRSSAWRQQRRWQEQQDWEGPPAKHLHRQQQQQQQQPHRHSHRDRGVGAWDGPGQQQQYHYQQVAGHVQEQDTSSTIGSHTRHSRREGYQQHQQQQQQQHKAQASSINRRTAGPTAAALGGAVWQGMSSPSSSSSSSSSKASPAAGITPAAVTPALLTRAISSTSSLAELQTLLNEHKDTLQQINVCAAFKALVRLAGAHSSSSNATALAVMRQLSNRMLQQIRVARPWDLATAAWACSKVRAIPCSICAPSCDLASPAAAGWLAACCVPPSMQFTCFVK
jgi:hypothetical protein